MLLVFKAIRVVIDVDVVLKGAVLIALTHVIGTKKAGEMQQFTLCFFFHF